jgi:hypothetical protein
MKKMIVFLFAMAVMAQGQALPVVGDIIQGGDAYIVRAPDSNALGKMRTSRHYVVDSAWSVSTAVKNGWWTENKAFYNCYFDTGTIFLNPLFAKDTNLYIPHYLYRGQYAPMLHRRIDWAKSTIDSGAEIPRQN